MKGGKFIWGPSRVSLYLSERQKSGPYAGWQLEDELKDKPVLNANVLDYLLAHPDLIPEDWKGKRVYFWGTIYQVEGFGRHVRYLTFDEKETNKWRWYWDRPENRKDGDWPAALRGGT